MGDEGNSILAPDSRVQPGTTLLAIVGVLPEDWNPFHPFQQGLLPAEDEEESTTRIEEFIENIARRKHYFGPETVALDEGTKCRFLAILTGTVRFRTSVQNPRNLGFARAASSLLESQDFLDRIIVLLDNAAPQYNEYSELDSLFRLLRDVDAATLMPYLGRFVGLLRERGVPSTFDGMGRRAGSVLTLLEKFGGEALAPHVGVLVDLLSREVYPSVTGPSDRPIDREAVLDFLCKKFDAATLKPHSEKIAALLHANEKFVRCRNWSDLQFHCVCPSDEMINHNLEVNLERRTRKCLEMIIARTET